MRHLEGTSNELDLKSAAEHVEWITEKQGGGLFCLRLVQDGADGKKFPRKTRFFLNTTSQIGLEVRQFLRREFLTGDHVFYSVNAFSEPSARAIYAVPGRILHVDADAVALPPDGPPPSRIVQSSPGNYHFFYVLSAPVEPTVAQELSRGLTRLVGGDAGGHSSAKLLRLPGTINAKY